MFQQSKKHLKFDIVPEKPRHYCKWSLECSDNDDGWVWDKDRAKARWYQGERDEEGRKDGRGVIILKESGML
jgi:hypothetical protein